MIDKGLKNCYSCKYKFEIRNPKHETNSIDRKSNDKNSFENLEIWILKIVSNFSIRVSDFKPYGTFSSFSETRRSSERINW
jgi:hypothetical protein